MAKKVPVRSGKPYSPAGTDAGRIRGRPVSSDAPNNGDVLAWSTSKKEWRPVPGGGSVYLPVLEDLSVQIDGQTMTFTTSAAYVSGTLEVWVNGLYQSVPSSGHFTETGPDSFKFNDFLLVVGMELAVRYQPS